ncbi:calcium/sodium antiporter [Gudongella sp. DL1XJH-153]|uniref:calcium/sodium antiporter n=1 Tax=Gudongella sp. DL1XJH-153 TaxID=3409804 RepID=UPI003BB7C084
MEDLILSFINPLPIIFLLGIIAVSLYTLSKGADLLIDEAVAVSSYLNVPKAIIGATIVSLGTTLPELSVSTMAAIQGSPDMALGNAVGSIITNSGLIIGLAALLKPIDIDRSSIKIQGWLKLLSAGMLIAFSLPFFSAGSEGTISQMMGFLFVAMLIAYLYWSFQESKRESALSENKNDEVASKAEIIKKFLLMGVGMAIVILSSQVLIPTVEVTAIKLGVPKSIIAATLVAFGTSLPELTTSIKAVLRGHGDLAVGNIIGADILNVLFVIGVSAAVTPEGLLVPALFYRIHYPAMAVILLTFRFVTLNKGNIIRRREGAILMAFYMIYLGMNLTNFI